MRVGIIGGAGKMGRWLARSLLAAGQEVTLFDRDVKRLAEAGKLLDTPTSTTLAPASTADALVLAVPICGFEQAVAELAPHTYLGQMVFDIASIKIIPVEVMHRLLPQCTVLGTHPVFGPGTAGLHAQNVVLTPTSLSESNLAEKLKAVLESHGALVSVMTPEKHDGLMAVVLGLAHFIALAAGDTVLSLDSFKELEQVSGPSFRSLLSLVTSVLHEDPGLYAAIQMNLPSLPGLESRFVSRASDWAELVQNHDSDAFMAKMSALRRKLEEQS